jgi:hypothetical protein
MYISEDGRDGISALEICSTFAAVPSRVLELKEHKLTSTPTNGPNTSRGR